MYVNDLARNGFLPLQHHEPDFPIQIRALVGATRVLGREPDSGKYITGQDDENTLAEGDILCATLWPVSDRGATKEKPAEETPTDEPTTTPQALAGAAIDLGLTGASKLGLDTITDEGSTNDGKDGGGGARPMPGWAFAWPAVTVGSGGSSTGGPGTAGGGGSTGKPAKQPKASAIAFPGKDGAPTIIQTVARINSAKSTALLGPKVTRVRPKTGTQPKPPTDKTQTRDKPTGGDDTSVRILPARDAKWGVDNRFTPLVANVHPDQGAIAPNTPGIMIGATDESQQIPLFLPTKPGSLIAVNFAGDPTLGSLVSDLRPDDTPDEARRARLQTLMRVVRLSAGKENRGNGLAWQMGPTGKGGLSGWGMVYGVPSQDLEGLNEARREGGVRMMVGLTWEEREALENQNRTRTRLTTPGGSQVGPTGPKPRPDQTRTRRGGGNGFAFGNGVVGYTAAGFGGPFELGKSDDQHVLGKTLDGEPIHPVHLSTDSIFYGKGGDAPLAFTPTIYTEPEEQPVRTKVYLRYSPGGVHKWGGRIGKGLWEFEGESTIYIPPEEEDGWLWPSPCKPEKPPPPPKCGTRTPPRVPRSGGTVLKSMSPGGSTTVRPNRCPTGGGGGPSGGILMPGGGDYGQPPGGNPSGDCNRAGKTSPPSGAPYTDGTAMGTGGGTTSVSPRNCPGPSVAPPPGTGVSPEVQDLIKNGEEIPSIDREAWQLVKGLPTPPSHPPAKQRRTSEKKQGGVLTPDGSDRPRALAYQFMQLATPTMLGMPQMMGPSRDDLRYNRRPTQMQMEATTINTPITYRVEAFGAQNAGEWEFKEPPGTGSYRGGTGPGGYVYMAPEVDMADFYAGNVETGGAADTSPTCIMAAPTATMGWAAPEFSLGTYRLGTMGEVDFNGRVGFDTNDGAGAFLAEAFGFTPDGYPVIRNGNENTLVEIPAETGMVAIATGIGGTRKGLFFAIDSAC